MGARYSAAVPLQLATLCGLGGQFRQGHLKALLHPRQVHVSHWLHGESLGEAGAQCPSTENSAWPSAWFRAPCPPVPFSVCGQGSLLHSVWTTRLPSPPEWLSSLLLYCLLLSSDPFGDLSFPCTSPRCLTPSFPPWVPSLLSLAPPCALELAYCLHCLRPLQLPADPTRLKSGETGHWASRRPFSLPWLRASPGSP